MKKIKITVGTFGWSHGRYDLVKAGDPPVEVDNALAKRLVEKGVAEYVAPFHEDAPDLPAGVTGIPAYNAEMKADELREIGEMCGLEFKKGMSKADMVAALDKHIEENMVDGVEVGEDGEIAVFDEDAPAFDAAEAVQ